MLLFARVHIEISELTLQRQTPLESEISQRNNKMFELISSEYR